MTDSAERDTDTPRVPTITDLISLPVPSPSAVSPDGRYVAYTVSTANWKDNRYESLCYMHDRDSGSTHQLTRRGSVSQVRWIDDQALAVLRRDFDAKKDESATQVWLFDGLVGEGWQVTDHDGSVTAFQPFADGIVFKAPHPKRSKQKPRKERFGTFVHREREDSADALYYVSLPRLRTYLDEMRACASEKDQKRLQRPVVELSAVLPKPMSISGFSVSPSSDSIYLTCRERDDLVFLDEPTCFVLRLDAEAALTEQLRIDAETDGNDGIKAGADDDDGRDADSDDSPPTDHIGELTQLALPPGATLGPVSPDGSRVVVRLRERDRKWYTQEDLFALDVTGPASELQSGDLAERLVKLSGGLDQDPLTTQWCEAGVLASVVEGTGSAIYLLADDAAPCRLDLGEALPSPMFESNRSGHLCFVGANRLQCQEVFRADVLAGGGVSELHHLTSFNDTTAALDLGTVETVTWTSKDGTEIEGVLRKPPGFEPGRRYPLAFVVHGGPSWASREWLLDGEDARYYPGVELASRGVLVLKPNYRGSLGRGQSFLELNARNLGVGDLWDLESAIDALVEEGLVDPDRVGCMGWSQGGYISAMAATHSDRFAAVSVGAGISDWYTYRVSNDIPQFTDHYLDATPYEDRDVYRKTAPIDALSERTAPMLIQHGENDQRVPLSNAMELFRGLQAMDVPVELFVYPGMGHPITKPRENRAVMWQNLTWFSHYLLGDALDFFRADAD